MVFTSAAANVDADDTHAGNDVYYGIPLAASNTTVSIPSGAAADSPVFSAPSISCDGNRIIFATKQSLSLADTDTDWDLYVHDLAFGNSQLIRGPSDTSFRPSEVTLSPNGMWFAFKTTAALDPVDTSNQFYNNVYGVSYSRDRLILGTPQLASQHAGVMGNAVSSFPAVGNFGGVGFLSNSSNFPPQDGNPNVYVNGCAPSRLELDTSDVMGTQSFEACDIYAENKRVTGPDGDLALKARRITLGAGFSVQTDATLMLENF